MLNKKNKKLEVEHEKLKQKNHTKKRKIFIVGATLGGVLVLTGHKLMKTVPIDQIKEKIVKIKEKVIKNVGEAKEELEEEFKSE